MSAISTYTAYDDLLDTSRTAAPFSPKDLDDHVATLLTYARLLSERQVERLLEGLGRVFDLGGFTAAVTNTKSVQSADDETFDVAFEIREQIKAVKAMRQAIMENGRLKEDVTAREGQALVSAASTLLNQLMKHQKEIVNMERVRRLEQAVIEILREEDEGLAQRVLDRFSSALDG